MTHKQLARLAMAGVLLAVFALGYVCGSVSVRPAVAQLPSLPGGLGGQAGGTLASVSQLGSSISDMDQHVTALQKDLDILRKVHSALGGK